MLNSMDSRANWMIAVKTKIRFMDPPPFDKGAGPHLRNIKLTEYVVFVNHFFPFYKGGLDRIKKEARPDIHKMITFIYVHTFPEETSQ